MTRVASVRHRVSRFRARSVGEAIAGVARSRRTFEYRRGLGLGPNASAPVMHSATSTSAASDRAVAIAVAIARVSLDVSGDERKASSPLARRKRNRIVLCPLSKLGTPHGRLAPLPPARGGSESSRLRRARRSRRFPAPWASPISTSPSTRSSTGASPRRRRSRLRRWRRCQCRTPPLQIRTRLPPPGGWTRRTVRRRRTRASRGAPRGRRARRSARSAACRSPTARGAEPGARRTTCSTMSGLCRNAGETSC